MRKLTPWFFAALAAVALAAGPAQALERYRFASGPAGGSWNSAVGAAAQFLNSKIGAKYYFDALTTQGSVENVRRVVSGQAHTSWAHVVQLHEQWTGTGSYKRDGVKQNFRIIGNVVVQAQNIAVLKSSPIQSFDDMKGKRVNLLARGSGSYVICHNILKALGLLDKIEPRYLDFAAAANALGDGQVDVYCSAGTPHSVPAIAQLSVLKPVRFVSMSEAEQKKISAQFPFLTPYTIPPIPKEVVGLDAPTRTISYDVWWIAGEKISDSAIYEMLKVIADKKNLAQLSQAAGFWRQLSGNFQAVKQLKMWVHPAAARYWREQGAQVPAEIVKGFSPKN